ncbi:MAG: pimeloyl-CoA dehydrogenase small subunit [Rhodospirillaceae bacterium]|nr:pimeloyl-CoA dehydrogenase small subunit [Rhodospirillaceae bacterium]
MDFSLNDDQRLLEESLGRFLHNEYDLPARRARIASDDGFSRQTWKTFADLGWLGVPFTEDDGGFGGGPVDVMVVMEAFGRALVVEPYLPTVLLGGRLIAEGGSEAMRRAILPAVIDGAMLLAFAHSELDARFDLADVTTSARRTDGGFVLSGRKSLVLGAAAADRLVVSARSGGDRRSRDGLSLFLVDPASDGITVHDYPTVDGHRAAEVTLTGVNVPSDALIGEEGNALPLIEDTVDRAVIALCAEAVGIMATMQAQTVEYLKGRSQFGVPIAKFQALQHRAVDMFAACEEARSMALFATLNADATPPERARAASAAKAFIGRKSRTLGQEAIQLHGGMGMTDEMMIGHLFKRLTVIGTLFGDTDHHLDRFADRASTA